VRIVNEQLNPNATRGYHAPATDREDFEEEEEEGNQRHGDEEDELKRE